MSDNTERMIRIWEFYDAPKRYQDLSQNGGDEDWVAVLPPYMETIPMFFDEGGSFGCCTVERHHLENGETVLIGCHA